VATEHAIERTLTVIQRGPYRYDMRFDGEAAYDAAYAKIPAQRFTSAQRIAMMSREMARRAVEAARAMRDAPSDVIGPVPDRHLTTRVLV
jgi:hypothetical protein